MKIRPLGSEVLPCGQKDGQTDMTLVVAFRKSATDPKMDEGNTNILRI